MAIDMRTGMASDGTIHMETRVVRSTQHRDFDVAVYANRITICVDAAQKWGFEYGELNRLFGIEGRAIGSPDNLRVHLTDVPSHDVKDRCDLIMGIKNELDIRFDQDVQAQRDWLEKTRSVWADDNARTVIAFADGAAGLREVLKLLQDQRSGAASASEISKERSGC